MATKTAFEQYRLDTLLAIAEGSDDNLLDEEGYAGMLARQESEWPAIDHAQRIAYGQSHEGCAGC